MFNSIVQTATAQPKAAAGNVGTGASIPPRMPAAPQQPQPERPRTLNIGSIGTSMQAIMARKNGNRAAATVQSQQQQSKKEPFDNAQLRLAWVELCNDISSQDIANAGRMKNLDIYITELPKVEVVISNQLLERYILGKKQWIEQFLARKLNNDELKIELRLAEIAEMASKGLTRAELFSELIKTSKAIATLNEKFHLELM